MPDGLCIIRNCSDPTVGAEFEYTLGDGVERRGHVCPTHLAFLTDHGTYSIGKTDED